MAMLLALATTLGVMMVLAMVMGMEDDGSSCLSMHMLENCLNSDHAGLVSHNHSLTDL
jgi:hypothetical protein